MPANMETRERGAAAAEDARQEAAETVRGIRDMAREQAEHLSADVGQRTHAIAEAVRSAGETLRGQEDWMADATLSLSRNLESLSQAIRERGFDGIRHDAERFARERPVLFMGAAVMAGLALGRVLRSSPYEPGAGEYGAESHPAGAAAASRPAAQNPTDRSTPTSTASEGGRHGSE